MLEGAAASVYNGADFFLTAPLSVSPRSLPKQKEKSTRGKAMGLGRASLELLVLLLLGGSSGSFSHTLLYQYVVVSEPSEGLPQFFTMGYLDDEIITYYDSQKKEKVPKVSWMKNVEKEDANYWKEGSEVLKSTQPVLREDLRDVQNRYKQNEGFHTWQVAYGCELRGNESKRGFSQYGYDGRTFLTFDKENLRWLATDPQAQITTSSWDTNTEWSEANKVYLEEECIKWLEKYLSYRKKEMLPSTETPVVTVSSRTEAEDGMETHICQIHGFYPREIDAFWMRDGEVWKEETFHTSVAPNADGTYHHWLSVRIDPKERRRYRCHVEHDSLQEPLDFVIKETPVVTVSSRTEAEDGMETHICQIHGFYPMDIDAFWTRDGEVWLEDTFDTPVAPTADGTYDYWLSVRIDPKERGRYRCHVEHDGLRDPLDMELKEPTNLKSNLGLIIFGCVALVLVCVIAGILVFKRRKDGYRAATTSDKGSNSSDWGKNQAI